MHLRELRAIADCACKDRERSISLDTYTLLFRNSTVHVFPDNTEYDHFLPNGSVLPSKTNEGPSSTFFLSLSCALQPSFLCLVLDLPCNTFMALEELVQSRERNVLASPLILQPSASALILSLAIRRAISRYTLSL